jgi:adenylosuccinate synthase
VDDVASEVWAAMDAGDRVMLEGTQGSGLSLHHGAYPYVTSADTNAATLAGDCGIAPADVRHVYLVVRTLPIRVAGNSGPMGREIDWSDLQAEVPGLVPEQTTVTKRIRRIAHWDDGVFRRAVGLNRPCAVFLMFADYLNPEAAGTVNPEAVEAQGNGFGHPKVLARHIEDEARCPVVAYGTGGPEWSLAWRGVECGHGDLVRLR